MSKLKIKSLSGLLFFNLVCATGVYSQNNYPTNESLNQKVYWGDLHTHSGLSFDSECSIEQLYQFAKNESDLDFIVVSDHDSYSSVSDWEESKLRANTSNEPGNFISFVGYEWTAYGGETGGHRVVIYPDDEGRRFNFQSSFSDKIEKITSLVLAEGGIMIVAHPDGNNFHANLDLVRNDVQIGIEFVGLNSNRFEYFGNPNPHPLQIKGNSVRDALLKGHTFGAIGSSDSHDCRPGQGGVTAVISDSLTRKNLFEAIKNRRVYATTGAKIMLNFSTEELNMGNAEFYSTDQLPLTPPEFKIMVKGSDELSRIQIIKNSEIIYETTGNGSDSLSIFYEDINWIEKDTYYYLKVIQKDGELAWSSPIFFKSEENYLSLYQEKNKYFISSSYNSPAKELNIEIYLQEDTYIEIIVYDILGKKVKEVVSGFYSNGYHIIRSQLTNISSGIYLIQMKGKSLLATSKVIILK